MPEVYIQFKPRMGCLFTHQPYWEEREELGGRAYFCNFCSSYFYYPSLKEHRPIYAKET